MATALAALATTVTLSAQSVARDSAGVRIVTSTRPAWSDREALRLDGTPRLIIGYTTDSAYRFSQVRGVMLLSDGRIAVADGASGQLRLFSADGRFLSAAAGKGTGPGQLQQMVSARRIRGDTIAIGSDYRTVMLYSGTAQYARTMSMPVQPGRGPAGRSFLIAVLDDGTRIGAPMPHQAPRHSGSRWTDSVELQLLATNDSVVHRLGAFPHVELMTIGSELTQPWLSPIAAFAGGADRFYAGYGDRYRIRVFDGRGKPLSIIERSWTPTPITREDWKHWVVEWSKRWVKSTGEQRERDVEGMMKAPYARQNPAFSEMIVDRTGRLWVREAHWQDAIAAGSLNDQPAIASRWSVFGADGTWLCDVTMPARFQPHEIGADYVAGSASSSEGNQVVIYDLRSQGR